jgi:hypothetical protein
MNNPIGTLLGFIGGGGQGPAGSIFQQGQGPGPLSAGGGGIGSILPNAAQNFIQGALGTADVSRVISKFGGSAAQPAPVTGKEGAILTALKALQAAGFSGDALVAWGAIAGAESGWNPMTHNAKPPDNSYGLWQINMLGGLGPSRRKQFGLSSNDALYDPATNARAAWSISGGGRNARPWSTWQNGSAERFVDPVYRIAKGAGMVGDPQRMQAMISAGKSGGGGGGGSFGIGIGSPIYISVSMPIQTSRATEPDARKLATQLSSILSDKLHEVTNLNA